MDNKLNKVYKVNTIKEIEDKTKESWIKTNQISQAIIIFKLETIFNEIYSFVIKKEMNDKYLYLYLIKKDIEWINLDLWKINELDKQNLIIKKNIWSFSYWFESIKKHISSLNLKSNNNKDFNSDDANLKDKIKVTNSL